MVFLSICTALHDYAPQGDNELAINEGELIFVLEKSTTDDWWKAKKRAPGEVDDEPVGLIPNNYIEEVSSNRAWQVLSISHAEKLEWSRPAPPALASFFKHVSK